MSVEKSAHDDGHVDVSYGGGEGCSHGSALDLVEYHGGKFEEIGVDTCVQELYYKIWVEQEKVWFSTHLIIYDL